MTRKHLLPGSLLLAAVLFAGTGFAQGVIRPAQTTATAPLLEYGEPVTGTLSESDGQNYKDGSRVQAFAFRGREGETAHIRLGSDDFDTYVTLFAPDGQVLDWNDDDWEADYSNFVWNSSLVYELPATGRYLVAVSGYSAFDLGHFQLEVDSKAAAAERDFTEALPLDFPGETTVAIDGNMAATGAGFSGPGQALTFELDEELLITVHSTSANLDPVLVLYDSEGNVLTFNDDHSDPQDRFTLDSFISAELEPGTYYLVAGTYSESWESYPQELTLTVKAYRSID